MVSSLPLASCAATDSSGVDYLGNPGGSPGTAGAGGSAVGAGGSSAGSAGAAGSGAAGAGAGGAGAAGAGAAGAGTGGSSTGGSGAGGSGGTPAGGSGGGSSSAGWYTGVNLAGADFGENSLPGNYNVDYIYPNSQEVDYFDSKGMNLVRVPFRWERLQQAAGGPLDATELGRLDGVVKPATQKGVYVLLDPHNYARYYGNTIGGGSVTNADFADFWSKVATHYKSNPHVIFGLVNEPHDLPTTQWLSAANAAIAAIRAAGAKQLILVPGNGWTGAWVWTQKGSTLSNSTVMTGVVDPDNNFAFEMHQYLDGNGSGGSPSCVSSTIGSERLKAATAWLESHHYRGFLGEFAGGNNPTCKAAVTDMLTYMANHKDAWIGWAWWAAGPWWGAYQYTLEPNNLGSANPGSRPQLSWLLPFE